MNAGRAYRERHVEPIVEEDGHRHPSEKRSGQPGQLPRPDRLEPELDRAGPSSDRGDAGGHGITIRQDPVVGHGDEAEVGG